MPRTKTVAVALTEEQKRIKSQNTRLGQLGRKVESLGKDMVKMAEDMAAHLEAFEEYKDLPIDDGDSAPSTRKASRKAPVKKSGGARSSCSAKTTRKAPARKKAPAKRSASKPVQKKRRTRR
jgi:hypothetical protein